MNIHMMLLARQILTVSLERKLQYSCVCYCLVMLWAKKSKHSYLDKQCDDKSQEVDHARPWDDVQLKQCFFFHTDSSIYKTRSQVVVHEANQFRFNQPYIYCSVVF